MKPQARIALLLLAGIALAGCNWFKGMGKKDNVEPPTPLAEFTPTIPVQALWSARVGDGAGDSGARVAPVIADGRVYAAGVDGTVAALDLASGKTIWSQRLGGRTGGFLRRGDRSLRWTGGPAVEGDLLVVGGLDGQVHALSAADGTPRWDAQVGSEVIAPPTIADGVVVVRTNDGRLMGLDAADGNRRWLVEQPVPALSLRGNSAPVVAAGIAYCGFDNGRVSAVRIVDGAELWQTTLSPAEGRTEVERLADVDGTVLVDGASVYAAGYHGTLASMAADNGRPLWQRDFSSYAGVAAGSGTLVAVDADGNVWAFDLATGANLWKQEGLKHRWLSAPAVQGDHVVVGDAEGYVHWLSLSEGKFAARERLSRKPIEAAPQVADGMVVVEDAEGHIGAWRAQ